MVPARNLLRRHYDSYGGCCSDYEPKTPSLRSNSMAEEPSQTPTRRPDDDNGDNQDDDEEVETSGGSKNWLQLGLGPPSTPSRRRQGPTELELFTDRPSPSSSPSPSDPRAIARPVVAGLPSAMVPVLPWLAPHQGMTFRHEVTPLPPPPPWGFWSSGPMMGSSSRAPPGMPEFVARQFMCPARSSGPFVAAGEIRTDMRVVSPPPRPTGIWFVLQAAPNQGREPFLPQIPKSYLRIKDGRMTVKLLMKYLVNKLGLEDESEVEITCRGQLLLPYLTLQHVRDSIWCLREPVRLVADSSSTNHVMTLQYGRSA